VKPRVLKFGGTSVGRVANLGTALGIIRSEARLRPVAVVVSALAGVTDRLVLARAAAAARTLDIDGFVGELAERHGTHLAALQVGTAEGAAALAAMAARLDRLRALLLEIAILGECSPAASDEAACLGERLAAPLVAAGLIARGLEAEAVDAADLIETDASFGGATVDFPRTRARVAAWWRDRRSECVPVVTGFFGGTADGRPAILGRGGSDYSAAVLAWALEAERVEIWTDVDGVMSADPRIVETAFTLRHLSYREAADLAAAGAKVLHPKTMAPCEAAGIPILIRNTARPSGVATRVADAGTGEAHRWSPAARAVAVALEGDSARVSAVASGRVGDPRAWTARMLRALERAGVAGARAEPLSPGATTVAVRVPAADRERACRAVHDALVARPRRIHLALTGATSRIGTAFLAELLTRTLATADGHELEIHLAGAWDRNRFLWDRAGLDPEAVGDALAQEGLAGVDLASAVAGCRALGDRPLVLVDASADRDAVTAYPELLAAGIAVVSANPAIHRTELPSFLGLREISRRSRVALRYGAALSVGPPGLRAVRDLRRNGEPLVELAGVLSTSLSYLFGQIARGVRLSQAVVDAEALGLLGSDPWRDLAGEGAAGELASLLREAGLASSPAEVAVEPLVPRPAGPSGDWLSAAAELDDLWADQARRAAQEGRRWIYRAHFERTGRLECRPVAVPLDDPLARLGTGEVGLVVHTGAGPGCAFSLSGPGATPMAVAGRMLAELAVAAEIAAHQGHGGATELTPWEGVEELAPVAFTRPAGAGF
jgi:aspartokinase/homoserine dehydrogenase 1